jgi:putative ABC transport system substrate-binding protein
VAVLVDANAFPRIQAVRDLVKPLGITLTLLATDTDAKLDAALAAVAADRPTALVTEPAAFPEIHFRRVADFALRHRLPSMTPYREATEAGMLMSYEYNINDLFRHAAGYVDRILRGAKPGDLPIEQPTKWDLAVNRKTARTLGITLPPTILAQATEVID